MRRRWSEPGTGRWAKLAAWIFLIILIVYFIFVLSTALARRFRAIRKSYEVSAAGAFAPGQDVEGHATYPRGQEDSGAHLRILPSLCAWATAGSGGAQQGMRKRSWPALR